VFKRQIGLTEARVMICIRMSHECRLFVSRRDVSRQVERPQPAVRGRHTSGPQQQLYIHYHCGPLQQQTARASCVQERAARG